MVDLTPQILMEDLIVWVGVTKKVFIFQNKTLAVQFLGLNKYLNSYKQLNKINLKI